MECMKSYVARAWQSLMLPKTWAPMLSGSVLSFLLSAALESLKAFAPWSASLYFIAAFIWPLSFQNITRKKGLQSALFFAGFIAIFLGVQLCYFLTVISTFGPLISFAPLLFLLFACMALAFVWPALFFLQEISAAELMRAMHLFREKPKASALLFGISFAPLGLSGLLYLWARTALVFIYGPIGAYAQFAALWPFLLLVGFSAAFFTEMAKQVKS